MIRLRKLREGKGWSQRKLWLKSGVDPTYISQAESRGFQLYPSQAERIAAALEWRGDPMELLEEVTENAAS